MILRRAVQQTTGSRRYLTTRAHTIYSPTPAFLDHFLTSHPPPDPSSSLYLLTTSIPPTTLSPLLQILRTHLPDSIGSCSLSPPHTEPSLSILTFSDTTSKTFRSGLTGRPPVEVGRWQRPKEESLGDMKGRDAGGMEDIMGREGWAGVWKEDESVGKVDELVGFRAKSVLVLTDGKPRPVLQALDGMYPGLTKAGLVTSPTPFLTGRQHTLMHGESVYSDGTVGIAFEEDLGVVDVDFGLQPLTSPFIITGAQGNMLLKIDGSNPNPTQTLMTAINARNAGSLAKKDEEFFLSLLETGRVVKILSGDPSRGAMSLDMEDPLIQGQTVQFMYKRDGGGLFGLNSGMVGLSSLGRTDDLDEGGAEGEARVLEGFRGFSEGGVIHSNKSGSGICTVPGARVSWRI